MDMRHMVDTHWTEQRFEDQLDHLAGKCRAGGGGEQALTEARAPEE